MLCDVSCDPIIDVLYVPGDSFSKVFKEKRSRARTVGDVNQQVRAMSRHRLARAVEAVLP